MASRVDLHSENVPDIPVQRPTGRVTMSRMIALCIAILRWVYFWRNALH
jgi:hypothetical protein